jgi:hypothetical protein
VADDKAAAARVLGTRPERAHARARVAATRQNASEYYCSEIGHHLYVGDTALHMAAAYRAPTVRTLVDRGQRSRRATFAGPSSSTPPPTASRALRPGTPTPRGRTITALIEAGADPDADKRGGAPLLRAVGTRYAATVARSSLEALTPNARTSEDRPRSSSPPGPPEGAAADHPRRARSNRRSSVCWRVRCPPRGPGLGDPERAGGALWSRRRRAKKSRGKTMTRRRPSAPARVASSSARPVASSLRQLSHDRVPERISTTTPMTQ